MLNYTLDTNCIIAIEENRAEAGKLRQLLKMNQAGAAQVRIVAIAASERQLSGVPLENFSKFQARISTTDLAKVEILRPLCYADVSYLDWSIVAGDEMLDLERKIHDVLFPNLPYEWNPAAADTHSKLWRQWLNAKCDVLTAWSHIYYHGDIFVTSDFNFLRSKKKQLIALGMGKIIAPAEI